jgi:hypothetical protein
VIVLALALQIPPPTWDTPWRPGEFRAELPLLRLQVPTPKARIHRDRPGEATVEVMAPGLSEEASALQQLRLELTLQARDTMALAGPNSLEGRAMLAVFSSFNASNIQGLADAQTRALQNLFNPPRLRTTWGPFSVSAAPERRR